MSETTMNVYLPSYDKETLKYDPMTQSFIRQLIDLKISECLCLLLDPQYCNADQHICRCYNMIWNDGYSAISGSYLCKATEHIIDDPDFEAEKLKPESKKVFQLIDDFQTNNQDHCLCRFLSQKEFCHSSTHLCRCDVSFNWLSPVKFCWADEHNCFCNVLGSSYVITQCYSTKHHCCCAYYPPICRATEEEHPCSCDRMRGIDNEENAMCLAKDDHMCICKNNVLFSNYQKCQSQQHPCICLLTYEYNLKHKKRFQTKYDCKSSDGHECICFEKFNTDCVAMEHRCQCHTKTYRCNTEVPCRKDGFPVKEHKCCCGIRLHCFAEKHRCSCKAEKEIRYGLNGNRKKYPKNHTFCVSSDIIRKIKKIRVSDQGYDYQCLVKLERKRQFADYLSQRDIYLPFKLIDLIFEYQNLEECPV